MKVRTMSVAQRAEEALAKELSDHLSKIRIGDTQAFAPFVLLTQDRLFRFCFRLCGAVPDAHELMQDTYFRAFKHARELPTGKGILSWLFTVAKNQFIDRTRSAEHKLKSQQIPNQSFEDSEQIVDRLKNASTTEIDQVLAVRDALARLDAEDRSLLVLIDLEGYAYLEVAEMFGVTESAVRSRLRRARERFFDAYEKPEGEVKR